MSQQQNQASESKGHDHHQDSHQELHDKNIPHDHKINYGCLKSFSGLYAVCSLCLFFVHFVLGVTFFEWEQAFTKDYLPLTNWLVFSEEHHAFLVSAKAIAGLSLILFFLQIIHLILVCKQKQNYFYNIVTIFIFLFFWAWFFCVITFISSSQTEHWKQYTRTKYFQERIFKDKKWCDNDPNRQFCKVSLVYFSIYYFSIFALFTQVFFLFSGHVMGYFAASKTERGNKLQAWSVIFFILCILGWLGHWVCVRLFLLFQYAPYFGAPTGQAWLSIWEMRADFVGFYRGLGYTEVTLLIMIVYSTVLIILLYTKYRALFNITLAIGIVLYLISWSSVVGMLASDQAYFKNHLIQKFKDAVDSPNERYCDFSAVPFQDPPQIGFKIFEQDLTLLSKNWLECRRGWTSQALYGYSIYICIGQFIFFFVAAFLGYKGVAHNFEAWHKVSQ